MSVKLHISLDLKSIKSLIIKGQLSNAFKVFKDIFSKIEKSELIPELKTIYDDFLILSSEYNLIKSIQQNKDIPDYYQAINKVTHRFISILDKIELKIKKDNITISEKTYPIDIDDVVTIELKINEDFSKFSEKEKLKLIDTISDILQIDSNEIVITHIKSGSTIIGVQLTLNKAQELINAIKLGRLKTHKIVETKLIKKVKEFTLNNCEPEESFLFVIELHEIKTKIKEMISSHPQKGLAEFINILNTSNSSRFDEALLVIGRYNMNFQNQIEAMVRYEDTTIEFSKIMKSAFRVINAIEEKDINKSMFQVEIG